MPCLAPATASSAARANRLRYVKCALLALAVALGCSRGSLAQTQMTIWPSTAVPSVVDAGADSPVELGVTFKSDISGYISGIRFHKSAANTGTHIGNLW